MRWLVPLAAGNFLYIGASELVPEVNKGDAFGTSLPHLALFAAGLGLFFALARFGDTDRRSGKSRRVLAMEGRAVGGCGPTGESPACGHRGLRLAFAGRSGRGPWTAEKHPRNLIRFAPA